jgi:anti-anti-sigma factor
VRSDTGASARGDRSPARRYIDRMELRIDESRGAAGDVVLTVSGSVDLASQGALLAKGQELLARGDLTAIALDLGDVTFLDSTGIGALVELSRDAEDQDVAFAIRNPSPRVTRVLEVTGLRDRWQVVSDS